MKTLKSSRQKLFLLFGDIAIIVFAFHTSIVLRLNTSFLSYVTNDSSPLAFLCLILFFVVSFYIFDLYNTQRKYSPLRIVAFILAALVLVSLLTAVFFYAFPFHIGRGVFLTGLLLTGFFVIPWRYFYLYIFKLTFSPRNVLVIGSDYKVDEVNSILSGNPEYDLRGYIYQNQENDYKGSVKNLGTLSSLEKVVSEQKISDIVVTFDLSGKEELNKRLLDFKVHGINVYDFLTFYEMRTGKVFLTGVKPIWFLTSSGFDKLSSRMYIRFKRIVDLVLSLLILMLGFPLFLMLGLAIKLSSKGPVLFIQERIGENQKNFNLIKFRTMIADAEKGDPQWAEENDIRITGIGRWLRKTRLDELPQFLNIAKGEMSLLGPRPERPFFVDQFEQKYMYYSLRFTIKPGLTGWAQVNYKYGSSEEDTLEKLKYDLYYIKNMSLLLDIRILMRTIRTVLFGKGR